MNRQNAVITFRMAAFLLHFLPYTEPTSLRGGSKRIHPVLVPDGWPEDGPEESLLFRTLS